MKKLRGSCEANSELIAILPGRDARFKCEELVVTISWAKA